jgi:putative transcriptional regulator
MIGRSPQIFRKRENTDMTLRSRGLAPLWAFLLAGAVHLAAQSKRPEDLAVGKMLVTTRGAPDPVFAKSVILLVRYGEAGALGLMVNRRTTMPISAALKDAEGAAGHSDPVFVGGPVELETVFGLTRTSRKPEGATEVFEDIYFIAARPALEKALGGAPNASGLRVYLGYCGWGPHQLENEVMHGGWHIFNRSEDLTFDTQPATLWPRLVGKAESQVARTRRGVLAISPSFAGF